MPKKITVESRQIAIKRVLTSTLGYPNILTDDTIVIDDQDKFKLYCIFDKPFQDLLLIFYLINAITRLKFYLIDYLIFVL